MGPISEAVRNGNGGLPNGVSDKSSKKERNSPKLPLPEKVFEVRESLLTDLFENPHIKVVKHIFAASLMVLMVNTLAHDYFKNGEINFGFSLISLGFTGIHLAVLVWILLNLFSVLAYYCFKIWANIRINVSSKSDHKSLLDVGGIILVLGYYTLMFRVVERFNAHFNLPVATGVTICLEQTRLLMKLHAFIRTNLNNVWKYKPHTEKKLTIAPLSHFVYFLFAPTLVYRDTYPRTKIIRWKFVFERIIELVGVIFYYAFLMEKFVIQPFKDIGTRHYSWGEIILMTLDNQLAGLLCFLCGFYVVLHSAQNLFGELLRFGDRLTYRDWWTSTNYARYFRTWNTVVGDWLYEYIYRDCYYYFVPGNKTFAKFMVFLISAIVHEWVLTHMLGFFFPALFFIFIFSGTICSMLKPPNSAVFNVLVWYSIMLGNGLLLSLYSMEYFVRKNLPLEIETFREMFVPRLVSCNCIG